MKKVLMILLVLAMVFSMAGVVSADEAEITYDVKEFYEASIPAGLIVYLADEKEGFDDDNVRSQYVGVNPSTILIPTDMALSVTMTSENDFSVVAKSRGITSSVQYVAGIPDSSSNSGYSKILNGAEILNLSVGDGDDYTVPLKFYTTPEWEKAARIGDRHSDTLTFEYEWVPYTWEPEWDGTADTSWYNEDATEFTLMTAAEFAGFAKLVDGGKTFEGKTIKLGADMDLEAYDENGDPICFDPIGSYRNKQAFKGTFDGQGYTIFNLNQNTWALNNGYYYGDLGLGLFGYVENATIKNLNIDGAEISGESAICGVVAGCSSGTTTYENIVVSNSKCNDYQYYAGGIVGWASGDQTFINCDVSESTTIGGQWGDFGNANGGVIGGISSSSTIYMKDCDIACRIDAVNDVVSAYPWYCYRNSGMLIGKTNVEATDEAVTNAAAPQLTCENVKVIYGDWANYHYCEFAGTGYPYVRAEAGTSVDAYSNVRYGHPTDANGNTVVDDNHVHNDGEAHMELITFNQLYGGPADHRYCIYGVAEHEGVTVIYNNK